MAGEKCSFIQLNNNCTGSMHDIERASDVNRPNSPNLLLNDVLLTLKLSLPVRVSYATH